MAAVENKRVEKKTFWVQSVKVCEINRVCQGIQDFRLSNSHPNLFIQGCKLCQRTLFKGPLKNCIIVKLQRYDPEVTKMDALLLSCT